MHTRLRHPVLIATVAAVALALTAAVSPFAQSAKPGTTKVTTPESFFGHQIGADYVLPNYTRYSEFVRQLDKDSDRMIVQSIGKTAEGRDQLMAIITAPENHKQLAKYKDIARRLALAEGLTDEQARALAKEGKAVVWIDGGLHATEVLGAQQLEEIIYQLVSRTDEETMRFLKDVIVLAVHANPDGMELVSNWYMRNSDPLKRELNSIPRLYQKYIGHDNNRDFYLSAQAESINMNHQLYHEWFPQILYNHHQTGPTGTILFAPPFRDPANYVYHPLIVTGLDVVGAAMHNRFVAENKPGATMRRGANYSTWWNGGLRTTVYFHNMIGLLTESIGHPTPMEVAFVPDRQIMSADLPFPIEPQKWHFRQSIEYSVTANRAVLDVASRNREIFLYNIYKMGKDSIDKGSKDTWTVYPRRLEAVKAEIARARGAADGGDARMVPGGLSRSTVPPAQYDSLMKKPEWRDPRAYILSASEGDFLTSTKFVNALIKTGVVVHRATAPFSAAGKSYPAGSYVVKTAQAFRPHVLDMFEPQDHPNDFQYPGGPPIPPYDNAGWTLAYQMGVKFDRVLDGVDGAFERLSGLQAPPRGSVSAAAGTVGYVLSHRHNDAFVVANRLLKAGEEVHAVADRTWRSTDGTGVFFVPAKASTLAVLQKAATDLGVSATAVTERPAGATHRLSKPRLGLWDRYGGSMPSGWTRWILEQYEFDFEVVYPQTLDAGNLRAKYDVLIFPDGGIPEPPSPGAAPNPMAEFFGRQPQAADIPAEFRGWLGNVTAKQTLPQLKRFAEEGGVLVAFGGSATLGEQLGLPVRDHLVEMTPRGERSLPRDKFYVPGSILRIAVDNTNPVAWGMEREVDVMFDNSPVLRLGPAAALKGARPAAWFDSATPLRSGWAWGQQYLQGGAAAVTAPLGQGRVFLFGPEITFRAQPHGTFKFLFNSLLVGPALTADASARQTIQQP